MSISDGEIQAMNHDIEPADTFGVDRTAGQVSADDYDELLMPGGTVNADKLRVDEDVRSFVRGIVDAGKPVGLICHVDRGIASSRSPKDLPAFCATVVEEFTAEKVS